MSERHRAPFHVTKLLYRPTLGLGFYGFDTKMVVVVKKTDEEESDFLRFALMTGNSRKRVK